jgi:hypothetical protein
MAVCLTTASQRTLVTLVNMATIFRRGTLTTVVNMVTISGTRTPVILVNISGTRTLVTLVNMLTTFSTGRVVIVVNMVTISGTKTLVILVNMVTTFSTGILVTLVYMVTIFNTGTLTAVTAVRTATKVVIDVCRSDIFVRFSQKLACVNKYYQKSPIEIFTHICPVGIEFFHSDRQTNGQTRSSQQSDNLRRGSTYPRTTLPANHPYGRIYFNQR